MRVQAVVMSCSCAFCNALVQLSRAGKSFSRRPSKIVLTAIEVFGIGLRRLARAMAADVQMPGAQMTTALPLDGIVCNSLAALFLGAVSSRARRPLIGGGVYVVYSYRTVRGSWSTFQLRAFTFQ